MSRRRLDIAKCVALAAILVLGLSLRIVFWYGLVTVDPFAYADSAANIARWLPGFDRAIMGNLYYTQYTRFSLTVPAAAMYCVFGPGEWQSTVVPMAASLGTVILAYDLAARVAGATAGLFSAFLAAVFPLSVINSSQFLPDTMLMFWAGLTMVLFLRGLDGRTRRRRALLFFATGLSWAFAFYAKQTAIALAIPFLMLLVARRRLYPEVCLGVPGALLVVAGVQFLLLSLGSSLFEDLRTVIGEGRDVQPGALGYTDLDLSYIEDLVSGGMFVPTTVAFVAGLTAIIVLDGWRGMARWGPGALLALIAGQYLYFEFLMRLPSLYSWWKEPRYILPMLLPMFAIAGIGFATLLDRTRGSGRKTTMICGLGGLGAIATLSVVAVRDDHHYWQTHRIDALAIELAEAIEAEPEATVFTWDDDLARYLSFHLGLDRTTAYERSRNVGLVRNRFDPATGADLVEPDSLVVISAAQDRPGLVTAAEADWVPIWEKHGVLTLFRTPPE
ncbi:MAG: glycosyltransferase family 39 protein [Dehalococcoidia bacterium]